MEELIRGLQEKITELQTNSNRVRQITVYPIIPLSLFVPGPGGEDALFIPQGKVSQVILQLLDAKEASFTLDIVTGERTISEHFTIKANQAVRNINVDIPGWAVVRAKLTCEEITARLVIGIVFKPNNTYVEKETIDERVDSGSVKVSS